MSERPPRGPQRLGSWLERWFAQPGRSVLRVVGQRILALGQWPALPTAHSDFRGGLAVVPGDAGVADAASICLKNAADTYAWEDLSRAALDSRYVNVSGDTMTGDLLVPDDAYAAGWNGSVEAPTKNALYDKIETLAAAAHTHDADDLGYSLVLQNNNYTGTSDSAAAQKFFNRSTNGAVTLGTGLHLFEFVIHIDTTDTDSAFLNMGFGGTAVVNWIGYGVLSAQNTTDVGNTLLLVWSTAATQTAITNAVATAKHVTLMGKGALDITTGGTLIPEFSWSAANQANPIVRRGSWFRVTPIAADTIGTWT